MSNNLDRLVDAIASFSDEAFGDVSERGPIGPLKHLKLEVDEAIAKPDDVSEYADIFILAIDSARRAGFTATELIEAAALGTLYITRRREWKKASGGDEALEHDRTGEVSS